MCPLFVDEVQWATEPLIGDSLHFATTLQDFLVLIWSMPQKDWIDLGAIHNFSTWEPWTGNPVPYPLSPMGGKIFRFVMFTLLENAFVSQIFTMTPLSVSPSFLPSSPRQREIIHTPKDHLSENLWTRKSNWARKNQWNLKFKTTHHIVKIQTTEK